MQSANAPLDLQPSGLYVILSVTADGDDEFEWGLYWSRSPRVGQSFRYRQRDGIWQYEQIRIPSAANPRRTPVEDNARVVLALHIENMDEDMENLLGETLSPRRFPHSLSTRARPQSNGGGGDSHFGHHAIHGGHDEYHSARPWGSKGRSRYWLGHALVVLNEAGFIGLKDGVTSAALIEREALARARENAASVPPRRTVGRTEHAIFDNEAPRPA